MILSIEVPEGGVIKIGEDTTNVKHDRLCTEYGHLRVAANLLHDTLRALTAGPGVAETGVVVMADTISSVGVVLESTKWVTEV